MFYQRVNSLGVFTVNHTLNNNDEDNENNEGDDIGSEESSSEDDEKADKVNGCKMKLFLFLKPRACLFGVIILSILHCCCYKGHREEKEIFSRTTTPSNA